MAINPAVLSALVRPRQSVADYEDMYAERDARQQRNALLQMQMKQAQQGMQQQETVRNAFAQYGASPQAVNALMSAGAYAEGTKLQEQLRAQAQEAMRRDALKALQPTQAIDANRVSGVTGPRPEALSVVGQKRPFDPAAMLAAGMSSKEVEGIRDLVAPTKEVKEYADERLPDGRVIRTALMKDGTVQRTDVSPFFKPEIKNTGAAWAAIDPVTRQATTVAPITMSAAERDASARGWAANSLAKERFAFDKDEATARRATLANPQAKKLTESEAKATSFLGQMRAAEETLGQLMPNQADPKEQVRVAMAGGPLNVMAGEKGQQVRQAQEQWAEAFLRFKTGAAATESEVSRNVKTFFPQFGDTQAVIDQKKRMREQAIADIGIVSGAGSERAEVVPSIRERSAPQGAAKAPTAQQGGLSLQEQAELDALRKRFGKGQ